MPQVAPVVAEEARSEDSPALRLDKLEVVAPNAEPTKVATVAETVKQVAIEAIQTTNEETVVAEQNQVDQTEPVPEQKSVDVVETVPTNVAAVVVPEVKSVAPVVEQEVRHLSEEPAAETVVQPLETPAAEVKSVLAPEPEVKVAEPVLANEVSESIEAKNIIPAAIIKDVPAVAEETFKVKQFSDDERPATVIDTVKSDTAEQTVEPVQPSVEPVQAVKSTDGAADADKDPNLRQSPPSLTSIAQGFINALGNLIPPLANQQAQQAAAATQDATSSASAASSPQPNAEDSLATGEVVGSSTAQPNIIQSAWNSITNILQRTTTAAPAAASATSDTRKDDTTVEVVQNIEVENANDKLDLSKKTTV